MLRAAFGDDVIDHYHHAAMWEVAEHDRVVTDFEISRLLERA
jgi:glutamine synthetase